MVNLLKRVVAAQRSVTYIIFRIIINVYHNFDMLKASFSAVKEPCDILFLAYVS